MVFLFRLISLSAWRVIAKRNQNQQVQGVVVKKKRERLCSVSARIVIEIVPTHPSSDYTAMANAYDLATLLHDFEMELRAFFQLWPEVRVSRNFAARDLILTPYYDSKKRGGPMGTPEDQKTKIVKGWQQVQGRMNQEVYASSQGIACSTLRRWIRELRQLGKL